MRKVIIEKPTAQQIEKKGIKGWPIWEKEVSRFDWTYSDDEECLILEGEITVEAEGEQFRIKPGDFVTFKKGLNCIWDISKPVKKHYNFP